MDRLVNGYRLVSNSEIQTFKQCRRKWWLQWYRGLASRQTEVQGVRSTGTRLHIGLDAYYQPEGQSTRAALAALAATQAEDLAKLQPMIDESMYLIPKIMVQDEIEHDGTYIKIPRRPIHPKPYQDPHPPLYMACTREATLRELPEVFANMLTGGSLGRTIVRL